MILGIGYIQYNKNKAIKKFKKDKNLKYWFILTLLAKFLKCLNLDLEYPILNSMNLLLVCDCLEFGCSLHFSSPLCLYETHKQISDNKIKRYTANI